jgi:predicted porin
LEYFYMKKTLIALAVLAASGASFAQATITGNYTFGYKQTQSAGAASTSGIGTDTAAVTFAASEDLGGGLKAAAQVSIASAYRGATVGGEDAKLTLTGGFGVLTMGTVESANGLLAIGSSGASGFGLDGNVISGSTNLDVIGYGLPLGNGLTLGISYTDVGAAGSAVPTLGAGTTGSAAGQSSWTAGVTYAAGPLAVKLDTTAYNRNGDTDVTSNTGQSRYRLSAAYDFGAARLSAGYSRKSSSGDVTAYETLVGVKAPLGAVTVGLDYAMASTDTMGTKGSEKQGYSLGVSYALSKRTSVSASYLNWDTKGVDGANTGFRTFVSHSF